MTKPYYKAVMLVLASHNAEVYREFRKIYQQYYEANPNVLVLMVYGHSPDLIPNDHDLVYDDIPENYYPGMITKTVRALEHIEQTYDYDFLVRTNISTFWVLDRLVDRLSKMPKEGCFKGSIRFFTHKDGTRTPNFISGVNLVLSRDMVNLILKHKEEMISWSHITEDLALSQNLINQGFTPEHAVPSPIQHLDRLYPFSADQLQEEIDVADSKNRDHFRIKNMKDRVNTDIPIAKILLEKYYGKTTF